MAEQKPDRRKAGVTLIAPRCEDTLSGQRLADLIAIHGERAAERMVCRHLEDVETAIDRLGQAWMAADRAGLAHAARRLARLAAFLHLPRTGAVAEGILDLLASGDDVALAASVARIQRMVLRLGDISDAADGRKV